MKKSIIILCLPILLFADDDQEQFLESRSYDLSNALTQWHTDYPFTPTNTAQNSPNNSPPSSPGNAESNLAINSSNDPSAVLSALTQLTMQYPASNQVEQDNDQGVIEVQEDNASDPFWNAVYACAVVLSFCFYFSH